MHVERGIKHYYNLTVLSSICLKRFVLQCNRDHFVDSPPSFMESKEADKVDEDRKVIEELRAINDYQKSQIMQLERSLKKPLTNYEEHKLLNENEMKKFKEVFDDLNRKLESCMRNIESKNVEVLNLEIALGHYNAEIEAKAKKATAFPPMCNKLSDSSEAKNRVAVWAQESA